MLKRIATKHPEIILQSLGTGLEIAASFQRQLSLANSETDVTSWTAAPRSAIVGLQTVYTEILQHSKQGRQAMITALTKRLEAACSVDSGADWEAEVMLMCANLAAQLPWKRGDEILVLLVGLMHTAAHSGDSILKAIKESAAAGGQTGQQAARAGYALAAVLLVVEFLMSRYSLSASRLAAFQDPEKRKAEERALFQQQPAEFQFTLSMAAFLSQQAMEQYAGLKALFNQFHVNSNYLAAVRTYEPQEENSPQAAVTPAWAQRIPGKGPKSGGVASGHAKSLGRKSGPQKRVQRARARKAARGSSGDESDDSQDADWA